MSPLEQELAIQIRGYRLPKPEVEYKFHPTRKWRFDFAWLDEQLACEVEGGTRSYGRHNRHAGFQRDCEKYNEATLLGWRVLRVTGEMVEKGDAIILLRRAFAKKEGLT